jgi:hypothetical protein
MIPADSREQEQRSHHDKLAIREILSFAVTVARLVNLSAN